MAELSPTPGTMQRGYSDLVNHAIAFAAVHHEGQWRKGTRVSYLSHLANVGIILAKYGQPDNVIVAAILHDVIEDCKAHSHGEHSESIERKFGAEILHDVLTVTKPETDANGRQLDREESKALYLSRVAKGSVRAKWVCAADKLHNSSCIISDHKRAKSADEVWGRFNQPKPETVMYYRRVYDALRLSGFHAPIMDELNETVTELERWADHPGS